jgi:putative Mn2+ efflux pump MntP
VSFGPISRGADQVLVRLIALVVPLGIDTFVVAAALGLKGLPARQRLRISTLFALFEAGMPVIGLLAGRPLGRALGSAAEYVAIGVLIGFGLFTLLRGEADEARVERLAEARGLGALFLGVSVSLDELAIGFTLGLLRLPVIPVLIAIAVQTFIVSQVGMRLGSRISERFREGAEKLAGLALTGLGVALLIEQLVA